LTVRFVPRPPRDAPERHLHTFWTMVGPTGKAITCELWELATGLEVRAMRASELPRSELCRGPLARDEAAVHAEDWRQALLAKGFTATAS
jgi:hypothetical protein